MAVLPYSQVFMIIEVDGSRLDGRGCGSPTSNEDKLKCTHCRKTQHTRDTCSDLVGRPRQNFSRSNSATINEGTALAIQGQQDTTFFEHAEELVTIPKRDLLDLK
ncbi:hypothetical protein AMTR_s00137p00030430 [Amborella trichopoda]|uniref:Uncharacterized protein n=1 Tax=Amborella trichopoda TaxID=13333 RepID=W1NDT7_AMBTC|nr:hypothetical protein AMTR_s00137p00030430 [Amborella trichopoda]